MNFPNQLTQSNTFNSIGMVLSQIYTELIGAEGTRLLLRKARLGETPQAQVPGPPAESECLKWKSTSKLYKPIKNRIFSQLSTVSHLPICQKFFHVEMAVKVMIEFSKKVLTTSASWALLIIQIILLSMEGNCSRIPQFRVK
ncbi:hypothetical protein CHI08_17840 [Peribacillus simplex]|nr:hypothetical protein CHI08_17840 [Peribacillus simplex]